MCVLNSLSFDLFLSQLSPIQSDLFHSVIRTKPSFILLIYHTKLHFISALMYHFRLTHFPTTVRHQVDCPVYLHLGRKVIPYFSIDNARVIYTKRSKFVKNEHARYTAVYISLGCALYIRCALSIEKYGN